MTNIWLVRVNELICNSELGGYNVRSDVLVLDLPMATPAANQCYFQKQHLGVTEHSNFHLGIDEWDNGSIHMKKALNIVARTCQCHACPIRSAHQNYHFGPFIQF